MATASATMLAPPPVSPSPAVHVVGQTATTIHLSVTGITTGVGQSPVNLILGESNNAGWQASVVGGGTLGDPVLIDGFANGWRLDPSSLGSAVHGGAVSVVLQWRPQTRVDVALIVSLVAILGCVVLAALPVRRRRRVGRHSRARAAARSRRVRPGDGRATGADGERPPPGHTVRVGTGAGAGMGGPGRRSAHRGGGGGIATPVVGLAVGRGHGGGPAGAPPPRAARGGGHRRRGGRGLVHGRPPGVHPCARPTDPGPCPSARPANWHGRGWCSSEPTARSRPCSPRRARRRHQPAPSAPSADGSG